MAEVQESIETLAQQSVETLKAYFQDTEPDKADLARAKIAASVFSSVIRFKQTQGAREALAWNMAQTLLDKDSLRDYIRVSQPDSPLVKALPEPKE